jgi:hypothetical protein
MNMKIDRTGSGKRKWLVRGFLAATLFALPASVPARDKADGACVATGDVEAFCGLPNPEDLEVLPDGHGVLVSAMHIERGPGGITGKPGSLKWLDTATGAVTVLYPSASAPAGSSTWGDQSCPGEIGAALLPHGFHLSRRKDGVWQLLVVNHNARESVEFFELKGHKGSWTLQWRGCAVPPGENRLNDVAALPDGGFVVTTMHYRPADAAATEGAADPAKDMGMLWRWEPGKGFSQVPGSTGFRPNGVQTDAAGQFAYIDTADNGGEVRKLDLMRGEVTGTARVPRADNASWSRSGTLLVTGMTATADGNACFKAPQEMCPAAFEVFEVDPATMQARSLFAHEGAPMGAGTVAVQQGKDMLIGSFAGDHVMAVRGFFAGGSGSGKMSGNE